MAAAVAPKSVDDELPDFGPFEVNLKTMEENMNSSQKQSQEELKVGGPAQNEESSPGVGISTGINSNVNMLRLYQ